MRNPFRRRRRERHTTPPAAAPAGAGRTGGVVKMPENFLDLSPRKQKQLIREFLRATSPGPAAAARRASQERRR